MNRIATILLLSLAMVVPATAGVVFEVETKENDTVETHEIIAEGKMLAMGLPDTGQVRDGEIVYNGELRQVTVVDHNSKSYLVFDQQVIEQIAGLAAQMQQMMKNIPEAQRGAVEEMMKKQMPQGAGPSSLAALEIQKSGEEADQAGYPCVRYDVLREESPVSELWVTDWSHIEGGEEIMDVFKDMTSFVQEIMESVSAGLGPMADQLDQGMLGLMSEIDGFPVVTRQFNDDGSIDTESVLRSSSRRELDPAAFDPPAGYKRQQIFQ